MINVIFVCLGNICRSPLGEGVFRELVREKGWENLFHIDSAGTAAYHNGESPDPGSRRVAKKHGFSIDEQRSRQFLKADKDRWDYVIAMDASNRANLLKLGEIGGELWLMRDFDDMDKGANVPDPWSMGDEAFLEVYQIVLRCCKNLLAYIAEKNGLQ